MQYISIKKELRENNKIVYLVGALTLKNAKGDTKQIIPHPLGDNFLEFDTVEDAIRAIEISGFKYILPDGTKPQATTRPDTKGKNYEELIYETLIEQTNDMNSSVVGAALVALGELKDIKLIELFIEKMGEENETIRTSSINALLQFGAGAVKYLIKSLKDDNWVRRNSAVISLSRLIDSESVNPEKIFTYLIEMTNDKNHVVKISAITALGKAYKLYKKENKNSN